MSAGRLHVDVAASGLEAVVSVDAGAVADGVSAERIVAEALAAANVRAGVDDAAVRLVAEALQSPDRTFDRVVVAAAQPPTPGRAASLQPTIELEAQPGVRRADGTVDFRDRELLHPVTQGEEIATFSPRVDPVDGIAVDGSALVGQGVSDERLRLGRGVELLDDGTVRAVISGVIAWDGNLALDVVAFVIHQGDVDLASGHLRMQGSLEVTGSVRDGFAVHATGDVEIKGDVDGGTIVAGGNVVVRGVVIGDGALVSARGHVVARRVQNATIRSRQSVLLEIDAIDATVIGSAVGVAGVVRGGRVQAETDVGVKDAGGVAVGAELAAGKPVEWPEDVARMIARGQVGSAGANGSGGRRSRAGARRRREGLARKVMTVEGRARQRAAARLARIDVSATASADVTIELGEQRLTLADAQRGVRFRLHPKNETIVSEELPP